MKKILFLVAIMLCCATAIFAQNSKISYQAVVRDAQNQLVANKTVTVEVSIFNGDAETATYSETQTTQTNLNGLISLLVGNGTVTSGNWGLIDWKIARIETTVTLDGTSLGTLAMPLTAVPYAMYAEYADQIDPEAAVVIGIYNKILYDSLALAGQITNLNTNLTDKIHEDSVALAGQINTVNSNLTDKIYADSLALGTLIDGNASEINDLKTADANFTTRMNNISDSVKTNFQNIAINKQAIIDSTAHVRNNLRDTASTLRGLIKTTDNKFADYYTKAESNELLGAKADTGRVYTRDIIDDKLATKANSTDIPTVPTNVSAFTNDAKYVSNAQCENLNICQLMTDVNNLLTTVGNLNNTIDNLNNTIAGMQQTINDLKDQNEDLAQRISEMEELEHVFDLSNISSDTTIKDGWKVTGTLNGNHKVTIAAGASVTFDGVNINGNGTSTTGDHAGITCAGDATIIMAHGSTNIVKGFNANYPGIYVPEGKTLTIEGSGSLDARSNGNAAGIGGGYGMDCGNIRIVEGIVTAKGGAGAAGIGGGENGKCGAITITEGVDIVTASKGTTAPNSVGAGKNATSCGKVTIGDVEYWDGTQYQNDGDSYLKQPTLVYHPIVTGVSLSSTSVEENVNGVFQLTATASPSDATVIWTVTGSDKVALYSDASCNTPLSTEAIVAGPVYVKALAAGTATIRVTSSDKTAECAVTVISNNDPVTIASTFGYCYDCQRSPAYPVSGSSCTFSGFSNPHAGNNTSTGPWKLEYKGSYESNDNPYNIYLDDYKSTYNIQSVPIFELFQWDGTSFQHAAYGVVCAYSNVTGNVDHTAFFEANNHWGCYLTGDSHSGSLELTFDEYMSSGLHSLIPNNTLSFITVSKGSSNFTSDHRLYYIPGETYSQALSNHPVQNAGWDTWGGNIGSVLWNTLFYNESSSNGKDLYIDGDSNFAPGAGSCSLTLDSPIDPTGHTFVFSAQQ